MRVFLAKRALRRRRRFILDIILTQSCARRFIARSNYVRAVHYITLVQHWWRNRVFMHAANAHMALLRSATIRIQTAFRRYAAMTTKYRRAEGSFILIKDWPSGEKIHQSRTKFEDGRDVLLSVYTADDGLIIKGVDLTAGHKKTWDVQSKLKWSSLTMFVALDRSLNLTSWEPEEFLERLLRSMSPSYFKFENCISKTGEQHSFVPMNGYTCKLSGELVRIPKVMQNFLQRWYQEKLAK